MFTPRITSAIVVTALALALAFLPSGCRRPEEKYLVPEMETAAEQLKFAVMVSLNASRLPVGKDKRHEVNEKIIRAYEVVIERFPEDKEYTPEAILYLGDFYFMLKKYRKAKKYFTQIRSDYPEKDLLQAKAMLKRGECLEKLGDTRQAFEIYKECKEIYAGHPDKKVQEVVQNAERLYQRILPAR